MDHNYYMRLALEEAAKAYKIGEVPIGAVVVVDDNVIAAGHDLRELLNDASAHAEMLVMKEAAQTLGDWRLSNATMYVTVEPCAMCAGAIVQYRLGKLVYGAPNSKSGSIDSILNIVKESRFNHQVEVIAGVLEDECKKIIRLFFKELRMKR